MGVQQPGKAPGASAQQIERRLQMVVNDALKVLDTATPVNPANQAEVDSLRSLIWSELTGLEAEFGREGGPRADRAERFFHHLLSSGDYIGQIETLGSALLGGELPPGQPAPGSPVDRLHQLHSSLTALRKQWQQGPAPSSAQPAGPARVSAQVRPDPLPAEPPQGANGQAKQMPFEKSAQALSANLESYEEFAVRDRRVSRPRAQTQPKPRAGRIERFFKDLGFGNFSPTAPKGEAEPPLPRALLTFVAVIIILALFGVGVIYLGLSGGSQPETGRGVVSTQTITIPTLTRGTPLATATLSTAEPKLAIQGNNLQVPCANSKQGTGFVLENAGGQILTWSAQVDPTGGTLFVSLSVSSGQLYGAAGTNTVVVMVTALVNTSVSGTITISSNGGTQTIQFHVLGC